MIFELFRLSLIERSPNLIDFMDKVAPFPDRETWLREQFASEIAFTHRRERFHFVPDRDLEAADSGIIVGRIGRKLQSKENTPPEGGLKEMERAVWHAVRLLFDPRTHEDGQKLAVERNSTVARGLALLMSLVTAINKSSATHPYNIEIRALSEMTSFWSFVSNHPQITSLTFEILAPNMFGINDDWDADSRELKDVENADKVKFQIESRDGLNIDTPRIRKSVDNTSRGTGTVKARAKDGTLFNSEESIKTQNIQNIDANSSWGDLIKAAFVSIFIK